MTGPRVISERVIDTSNWLDGNVHDFIAWLTEQINAVPEAHRSDVEFNFHSGDDYDPPSLTLSYDRSETLVEMAEREAAERKERERIETKERVQLARLQQKYGKRN